MGEPKSMDYGDQFNSNLYARQRGSPAADHSKCSIWGVLLSIDQSLGAGGNRSSQLFGQYESHSYIQYRNGRVAGAQHGAFVMALSMNN